MTRARWTHVFMYRPCQARMMPHGGGGGLFVGRGGLFFAVSPRFSVNPGRSDTGVRIYRAGFGRNVSRDPRTAVRDLEIRPRKAHHIIREDENAIRTGKNFSGEDKNVSGPLDNLARE